VSPAAVSPARAIAYRVLLKYGRSHGHLSDILRADAGYTGLDDRDAGLAHELVYGVVRRLGSLDAVLQTFASAPLGRVEPAVLWALRLGAYQILFLDRVPAHAAVGESVALVRRRQAAGFVNAILRRVAQTGAAELARLTSGLDGSADLVLLDAPCTGLGTLALQPDLRWRARAHDAERLATLQRELLARAEKLLRPGGLLIYSVCTITPEETVETVAAATAAGGLVHEDLGSAYPALRDPRQGGSLLVMPDIERTTGFFVAHLRRAE
jgi:transcription termination factor NusB